jgi:hypothetical protein
MAMPRISILPFMMTSPAERWPESEVSSHRKAWTNDH